MIEELARAKLNLALHVRARRPDGYHDIETLFLFVDDGDWIRLEDAGVPRFTVEGPFAADLAGEDDNLVLRAERAFRERFGAQAPLAVTLDKRLPVASGIGGGSADAAAMLRALARRFGIDPEGPELFEIAAGLGADVPACLLGRPARGTGRGEVLAPLSATGGIPVLLVNPLVPVSTAAVFAGWDGVDRGPLPAGDPIGVAIAARNDLEPAARRIAPAIGDVLALLAEQPGLRLARMSGSGATCFALFDRESDRAAAANGIRSAQPGWWCLETALA